MLPITIDSCLPIGGSMNRIAMIKCNLDIYNLNRISSKPKRCCLWTRHLSQNYMTLNSSASNEVE